MADVETLQLMLSSYFVRVQTDLKFYTICQKIVCKKKSVKNTKISDKLKYYEKNLFRTFSLFFNVEITMLISFVPKPSKIILFWLLHFCYGQVWSAKKNI